MITKRISKNNLFVRTFLLILKFVRHNFRRAFKIPNTIFYKFCYFSTIIFLYVITIFLQKNRFSADTILRPHFYLRSVIVTIKLGFYRHKAAKLFTITLRCIHLRSQSAIYAPHCCQKCIFEYASQFITYIVA